VLRAAGQWRQQDGCVACAVATRGVSVWGVCGRGLAWSGERHAVQVVGAVAAASIPGARWMPGHEFVAAIRLQQLTAPLACCQTPKLAAHAGACTAVWHAPVLQLLLLCSTVLAGAGSTPSPPKWCPSRALALEPRQCSCCQGGMVPCKPVAWWHMLLRPCTHVPMCCCACVPAGVVEMCLRHCHGAQGP
jgi:hypothetical protein